MFENAVVAEVLKHRFNRGLQSNLSFFRDARGLECDFFYETGGGIGAVEIKAGSTVNPDYFRSLNRVAELIPEVSCQGRCLWRHRGSVPERLRGRAARRLAGSAGRLRPVSYFASSANVIFHSPSTFWKGHANASRAQGLLHGQVHFPFVVADYLRRGLLAHPQLYAKELDHSYIVADRTILLLAVVLLQIPNALSAS